MSEVHRYRTMFESNTAYLDQNVTDLLNKGWMLYGNQHAVVYNDGELMVFQVMVMTEEVEDEDDGDSGEAEE